MKKYGFTLVELLAVIVILAIISIIAVPMIGNVIEDSRKQALEQSANGIVESARYFAISKDGTYNFKFNDSLRGKTISGEELNYTGDIDANGDVYIDNDGDISLCLMNDKYYVYKNYNGTVQTGERTDEVYCIIGHDALTDKYIAKLDDGTGTNNYYTNEEFNALVDSLNSSVSANTTEIESIDTNIDLSDYATQAELDATNNNVNTLEEAVSSNEDRIAALEAQQ